MYTKDPFFAVKEEVEQNFANATTIFQSWSRIYNTVASRNNEELQRTEEELTGMLQNVGMDLDDLEETISVVESDPSKFGLTKQDVVSRRQFVETTREQIQQMRLTLADPPKKLQTSDNKRRQELMEGGRALRAADNHSSRVRYEDVEMKSSQFIENEMAHQSILIEEQDEHLDSLYGTARNIHEIATIMGQEIEDQTTLLDEFGGQVDRVQDRLSRAMSKVAYIIKKNEESRSECCIGILIVILVILLILVVAI